MQIVFGFTQDNGFVAGDITSGVTSYAYQTSTHANAAKRSPNKVAAEMIEHELRWRTYPYDKGYDARNWQSLHDLISDHTTRAIIDAKADFLGLHA